MKASHWIRGMVGVGAMLAGVAAHAAIVPITNSSFETPATTTPGQVITLGGAGVLPGWTTTSGPNSRYFKLFGSAYFNPHDQVQTLVADLNPIGTGKFESFTVEQTLTTQTVAGQSYVLSLYMGSNGTEQPQASFQLQFNGVTVASVTPASLADASTNPLVQYSTTPFTAAASGQSIKIIFSAANTSNVNGQQVIFDAFELTAVPVPEPSSGLILLGPVLGMLAVRRRRLEA